MYLEELRQQHARGVGKVRTRAALDLREIRLADALLHLLLHGAGDLKLRHLAVKSTQRAFYGAQVTDFFAQLHSKLESIYCNLQIIVKRHFRSVFSYLGLFTRKL